MKIMRTIVIAVIVAILTTGRASSSPYVFAAKLDPGFMNSSKCKIFATDSSIKIQRVVGKKAIGMYFVKLADIKLVKGIRNVMIKNFSLIHHQILHHHLVPQHPYKMMEL